MCVFSDFPLNTHTPTQSQWLDGYRCYFEVKDRSGCQRGTLFHSHIIYLFLQKPSAFEL